ncbi:MAG: acyltransferase [Bacteriovorax sp.]
MPTLKDRLLILAFKRLQHFLPLIFLSIMTFCFIKFIKTTHVLYFIFFALTPYLLPLLLQRMVFFFYPLKEGGSYIGMEEKKFSPWLFSLRVQQIYLICPQLERIIFFFPGTYSIWLRAWGSKIGKRVFWTPGTVVNDRGLLEVGDYVVFGHNTYMSPHLLRMKDGKFFVYVKKIKIGSYSFVGAFSKLGPGTTIGKGSFVPAASEFAVNQKFNKDQNQ